MFYSLHNITLFRSVWWRNSCKNKRIYRWPLWVVMFLLISEIWFNGKRLNNNKWIWLNNNKSINYSLLVATTWKVLNVENLFSTCLLSQTRFAILYKSFALFWINLYCHVLDRPVLLCFGSPCFVVFLDYPVVFFWITLSCLFLRIWSAHSTHGIVGRDVMHTIKE